MAPAFRVLIVGGGITGLTLANMLEKFGIDYVLLEAHANIAPSVGASIGLFPNGLRILDQLGCYEPIMQLPQRPMRIWHSRNGKGESKFCMLGTHDIIQQRHGYPILFFDRQWLLQILYDNLQHKENVLTNKKAVSISHSSNEVKIVTSDGSSETGTFVVGADGIYSTVRQQMFELGQQLRPGWFSPGEEDRVPCYYRCNFGIAKDVPNYITGEQNIVRAPGYTILLISGPEDRVYWFFCQRLPEPRFGSNIPKYTSEDEAHFVSQVSNYKITDILTFGHIYEKRISSALTPLHEVLYEKWFFKRFICLGDSVHKPNPLGGQGGNNAIESAAVLVDALLRMRRELNNEAAVGEHELTKTFERVQALRFERVKSIVEGARQGQAMSAYENPLRSTLLFEVLGPHLGNSYFHDLLAAPVPGAARLQHLPVPRRAREIPFTDELPAKPLGGRITLIFKVAFLGAILFFFMSPGDDPAMSCLDTTGRIPEGPWDQIQPSRFLRNSQPTCCEPLGHNSFSAAQQMYLISQIISPTLIYTIAGYRESNQGSLLSVPSLFLAMIPLSGIVPVTAMHSALTVTQGYGLPAGRHICCGVSERFVSAAVVSYLIPTIMQSLNYSSGDIAVSHGSSPVLFASSIWLASVGLHLWLRYCTATGPSPTGPRTKTPAFKSTLMVVFVIQAAAHLFALLYSYHHYTSLLSVPSLDFGGQKHAIVKLTVLWYNCQFSAIAKLWLLDGLYSIWHLRRLGYIRTMPTVIAAGCAIVSQIFLGPAATWIGTSYWRDRILAGLQQ